MADSIAARASQEDVLEIVIEVLARALPLAAVRKSGDDEIAIEDEAGKDWTLVLYAPN